MAKSKESFNKKEKEKKRLKQKQDKRERMEERKANAGKKSFDDMIAYIDEDGNITSTPPDPTKKRKEINLEDIEIGVRKQEDIPEDAVNEGTINYFDESKGFGFISRKHAEERLFFHINNTLEKVKEGDKVVFDIEKGPRGLSAVNVKKA
jgi:cold shock CspA family protein